MFYSLQSIIFNIHLIIIQVICVFILTMVFSYPKASEVMDFFRVKFTCSDFILQQSIKSRYYNLYFREFM